MSVSVILGHPPASGVTIPDRRTTRIVTPMNKTVSRNTDRVEYHGEHGDSLLRDPRSYQHGEPVPNLLVDVNAFACLDGHRNSVVNALIQGTSLLLAHHAQ